MVLITMGRQTKTKPEWTLDDFYEGSCLIDLGIEADKQGIPLPSTMIRKPGGSILS